jgi:hypothetical protein
MTTIRLTLVRAICAAVCCALAAHAGITTVEITDTVLVSNTMRFGVNLGTDKYYDGGALLKQRDSVNFEGTMYRQCHQGTVFTDGFGTIDVTTNTITRTGWSRTLLSGAFEIIAGPLAGTTGTIVAVSNRYMRLYGSTWGTQPLFMFDRPLALPGGATMLEDKGILVEALNVREGCFQRNLNGTYWLTTSTCALVQGDVPPGAAGSTACRMNAGTTMRMSTSGQRYADNNGVWTSAFWAKKVSGTPNLSVQAQYGATRSVTPTGDWQRYELGFTMSGVPETPGSPVFTFTVSGGTLLLDDCAVWKASETNGTAFRNDLLAFLRDYRPGIIRDLQMGGNAVSNTILPLLSAACATSDPNDDTGPAYGQTLQDYGLHDFYGLCEQVDAEPWYSLPGTLHRAEMTQFMEYLAGPTNSGFGALRAALGHPAPWTKTLRRIHVEFGNEAWNGISPYKCGGYNGPDYWSNLIVTAKASPYYTNSVLFHAAGQNFSATMSKSILRDTPSADRYAIAPYILKDLTLEDTGYNDTLEKLFRWFFAYPMMSTYSNGMPAQGTVMTNTQVEFSVYEMNHHTVDGDAALLPQINALMTSAGAGLNVANTMLAMLKQYGMRSQCFFTLFQEGYGSLGGTVALWGNSLNMRPGYELMRPTGLAQKAVNRVIGGDLLRTIHTGDDPRYTARGRFRGYTAGSTNQILTVSFPCVQSYAFREGQRHGIVLFNFDVAATQSVVLRLPVAPQDRMAGAWLLAGPTLTANNEYTSLTPQVPLQEFALNNFTNGVRLELPPVSLMAINWYIPEPAALALAGIAMLCLRRGNGIL